MTSLHELRKRLARLRRRRQRIRWATGYSGLLLAVLWVAGAALLFEWSFERMMTVPARVCVLGVCAAAVIAAFFLFVRPWLVQRESDLDMALLVERAEQIDGVTTSNSDLIAAMQFESPEAPEWGSVQLEQAVIENVAVAVTGSDAGKRLNVMRGLSRKELSRRFLLLLVSATVWAGVYWGARGHVEAFLSRMFLLSGAHYPTGTQIDAIAIKSGHGGKDEARMTNDAARSSYFVIRHSNFVIHVDPVDPGRTPIKIPFAHKARFEVKCSGKLPKKGRVELNASLSKVRTAIELKPRAKGSDVYVGELGPLREKVFYRLYLGDAWTDWAVLGISQLPIVTVELEVVPPPYAQGPDYTGPLKMPVGRRQISVIEGSQVLVKVSSDKRLKEVRLKIIGQTANDADGNQSFAFDRVKKDPNKDNHDVWLLDSKQSPLDAVVEPIRYAVTVLDTVTESDVDDQCSQRPIEGMIRIRADTPPRIAAATNTPFVVPVAVPTIYYRAIDDYGVDRVYATYSVARGDNERAAVGEIPLFSAESGTRRVHLEKGHAIDLSPLGLQKNDQLTVTLHAVDYRGERAGRSAEADPLVFQVTDQQGILAAQLEFDRQSAGKLNTIIRQQLGIGDPP